MNLPLIIECSLLSLLISSENCVACKIFNIRISASVISSAHNDPTCLLAGRNRRQYATILRNLE